MKFYLVCTVIAFAQDAEVMVVVERSEKITVSINIFTRNLVCYHARHCCLWF
jgi:hypothetical protein